MAHTLFSYDVLQTKRIPSASNVNELRSGWHIHAPALRDTRELIQINQSCVLSIGCHLRHGKVLISKEHKITHDEANRICDFLTFLFDSPIALLHPFKPGDRRGFSRFFKGMPALQRARGLPATSDEIYQSYFGSIESAFSAITELTGDSFGRVPPLPRAGKGKAISIALPDESSVGRSVHVYRQALISIEPSGQILNYWRALEAITGPSVGARRDLLESLEEKRLGRVAGVDSYFSGQKSFDLMARYLKIARARLRALVKAEGSISKALDFLYHQGRNPSAHADYRILQASPDRTLADITKDTILLKCLARLAIETKWRANPKPR